MDTATLLQSFANGVAFGAILAMCAIGLTLVYGILSLSNFAHGDFLTFGAYAVLFFGVSGWLGYAYLVPVALVVALLALALGLLDRFAARRFRASEDWTLAGYGLALLAATLALWALGPGGAGTTLRVLLVAGLLAVAATVLVNVALEYVLWRPLRRRGATVLSLVIASLGLSLVVRNGLQMYFGGDQRNLDRPVDEANTYFGVHLAAAQVVTIVSAVVVIGLVHLFLTRTRTGKAMRALADNRDLARVCGVDVDRVVVYVWVLSSALVAFGGVLLALVQNNTLTVNMGFGLIIPLFAAVILGGIGSAYGAVLGGLVVGVAMKMGPGKYDLAVAFLVLVAVLLVRPQGILGRKA